MKVFIWKLLYDESEMAQARQHKLNLRITAVLKKNVRYRIANLQIYISRVHFNSLQISKVLL